MKNYGEKIAELRTARRMTQAELGAMLNVTSQAVSKWEKGLSEPDMDSIRKLCEIFEISFDEFFGVEPKQAAATEEVEQPAPEQVNVNNGGVVIAYCDVCDKAMYSPKEYQVTIEKGVQHTTCKECVAKREEQKRKARDEHLLAARNAQRSGEVEQLRKGLLWGILGAVVLAGIMLVGGIYGDNEAWEVAVVTIAAAYGGYAIVSQCIWGNSVLSVLTFFLRSFRLPGIIFTLSIQGLLFLIVVKIAGAILCAILSVIVFIVGFFITWAYAMVIFPFALIKEIREIRQMY